MTPEEQQTLDDSVKNIAQILYKNTPLEKLQDFESIELAVREQLLAEVSPKIGAFFFAEGKEEVTEKKRTVKTCLGIIEISRKQAQKLGLKKYSRLSPVLEKSCLRLNANESYKKAEEEIKMLTGIEIGHSSQHRLVQKVEIPLGEARATVEELSVDGGKIKVRAEEGGQGEWRDYKAVNLHGSVCAAFFQDKKGLEEWSEKQPLSRVLTCVGDGHEGVWNLINLMGRESVKREVLDWFHLKENLYRVGGSLKRLKRVEGWLWRGLIEEAMAEFKGFNGKRVQNFQNYLQKHRSRIPDYELYQQLGICIGSGAVESTIKQIGARVKLTGAQWKKENIPQILRLRSAYLNDDNFLSIPA